MRQFKFRVWDKKAGQLHYVSGIRYLPDSSGETIFVEGYFPDTPEYFTWPKEQITVTINTGVLDWGGFEIYEGDILVIDQDQTLPLKQCSKYAVVWDTRLVGFNCVSNSGDGYGPFTRSLGNRTKQDELVPKRIVGNVYQNPELMHL